MFCVKLAKAHELKKKHSQQTHSYWFMSLCVVHIKSGHAINGQF